MIFSGGIFAVLCFHNIKNRIFFLSLTGVPGAPEGRSINTMQGFFGRYSKKRKKELLTMQFDHIFSGGIFRESLLP